MAPEISVDREFRFHCSCGATITTGERTVTCAACGITLGVRRVRRHRQHSRDTVSYYGERFNSRGALKVRRVERRAQHANVQNEELSETAAKSRLLEWARGVLDKLVPRREAQDFVSNWGKTEAVSSSDKTEVLSDSSESQVVGSRLALYSRVKVGPRRPDGTPHPHAGKTGRITRFLEDPPAAMVHVDAGIEPQGFVYVSLECLEQIRGNQT